MLGFLRLGLCTAVVVLCVASTANGYFFDSLSGLAADIMRKPLESFSLFALKSYLLGHVGGRVTQYRQMMYRPHNQYPGFPNQYMPVLPRSLRGNNVHSRGRRSLLLADDAVTGDRRKPMVNLDDGANDVGDQFLQMAEKLDVDKCIPRLICDVMAGNQVTNGGHFESLVTRVLGDEVPEKKDDQNLFPSIYHYAAYAGKRAVSAEVCRELFPKCKASEMEFTKMADKIFAGVQEIDDVGSDEDDTDDAALLLENDDDDGDDANNNNGGEVFTSQESVEVVEPKVKTPQQKEQQQ